MEDDAPHLGIQAPYSFEERFMAYCSSYRTQVVRKIIACMAPMTACHSRVLSCYPFLSGLSSRPSSRTRSLVTASSSRMGNFHRGHRTANNPCHIWPNGR